MKTEIFPYAFGRVGGASFNMLLSLQDHQLNALLQEFERHTFTSYEIIKDKIIVKLYETINSVKDPQLQNKLLNLKRAIYNDRNVDKYLNHLTIVNDREIIALVEKFICSLNKLKTLRSAIDNVYQESINKLVQQVQQGSLQFFLSNGLLFSSDSIYQNVEKATGGYSPVKGKKRDTHVAMGLLKYLTRSVAKTSPFSSFNSIFALQERNEVFAPVDTACKYSNLSINNLIYLLFKKVLISDYGIKSSFNIFLNPTLTENGKEFQYFHNHDNKEAFYNIQRSEVLDFLINIGKEKKITYGELVKEIEKASRESTLHAITFVEQLLSKGIITLQLPVSIKEKDWPQKLLTCLENCKAKENTSQTIECLIAILKNLLFSIDIIEKSLDTKIRKEVINGSFQHLTEQLNNVQHKFITTQTDAILSKLSPENLFYEDVVTDSVNEIAACSYRTKFNKASKLHQLLSKHNIKNEARQNIASKITEIYKCSKVPLLTFYRDVYLQSGMNEKMLTNYQTALFTIIDNHLQATGYNISDEKVDLEKAFEDLPNDYSSFDLFVQIGTIDGPDTLVVNNMLSGAMTNVSRFINLYSEGNLIDELKLQLNSLYKNSIVAELVDASIHNVNTFPCLANYVIDVSLHVSDCQKNINLNDLFIRINNKQNVILENREGRQIMPIDFSMESIRRRSSLMKFIDIFNDTNSEGLSALLGIYYQCILLRRSMSKVTDPVVTLPRLYFSEDIILQRKKWFINSNFLDQFFTGSSSESMQFVSFNSWRKKLKMPDHVFIRINSPENGHKPQYINLSSPILFKLFKNMVTKTAESIEITEMLPAPEHLVNNKNNDPYVMEHIFTLINTSC